MGTIITGEFARRFGGDLFTRTRRGFVAIGLVSCLTVAGLAVALTGAGAAFSPQADVVSVDRTHKGDRLDEPSLKYCCVSRYAKAVVNRLRRQVDVHVPSKK